MYRITENGDGTWIVVSLMTGEVVTTEDTRAACEQCVQRLTDANRQVLAHINNVLFAVRR